MYNHGEGTPQDYKEAVRWYRAAAEQGYAKAQYNLGLRYKNGEGTIQDYKLAHMWWNIAAANGQEDAKNNRDNIALDMTSAGISEAQQMATDWMKAHP
ncbi:sel1 repeat family protein [Pseudomonadales bacterium]|nr:sel1 repeat family protein [Pseudomonadales bacterium]